jgi:acyl-CoA reductase-like NAD-dependent aldehyde dehydrogenase
MLPDASARPEAVASLSSERSSATHRRPVESRDPRTGVTWRTWPFPSPDEIQAHLALARHAHADWAATPLAARLAMIARFRAICFSRRQELAALIAHEVGKSHSDALGADVLVTLDLARYFTAIARRTLRPRRERGASLAMVRKTIEIRREPFGVIAVISPWNYPLMLAAGIVIPALISGNAVILKPSESSTATAEALMLMLVEAGVPAGICQCLPGDAETGAALIAAGVDKVFFTGSVRGGQAVSAACGARMIPVNLELGGSDAAIVTAEADLAATARGLVWGRFYTSGQTCVAPKRVFAHTDIYDALVASLAAEIRTLQIGSAHGAHIGPLIRPEQVRALAEQRDDAIACGARVAFEHADAAVQSTSYASPVLLVDVPPSARVMTEEAFGPLLAVARVADTAEAIARANMSDFGLSASIWSRDVSAAAELARQLDVGTVLINDVVVNVGIPNLPHGGVKASGTGRSHGVEGLLECTYAFTIVCDCIGWMPQPWWFTPRADKTAFLDGVAAAGHAPTLWQRATGAWNALRSWPRRA